MPEFRVRAVVFDLDGVLVDSMAAIRAYWTGWAARRGVPADAVLADLHLTAEELVRRFAPGLDPLVEAAATALGQAEMETGIVPLPGGRALIDALPAERWAVVTSGRRHLAGRHLELGGLPVPRVLITAEDTPRGKPDPAGFRLAADRLGVSAEHCLAFEDTPAGVQAARAAGMSVVAVTNTHGAAELGEAHAIIDSLASVRVGRDGAHLVIAVGEK